MERNMERVAIIGAGVSGCFLAHLIQGCAGIDVTLFEKSRGFGGRCAVRRDKEYGEFKLGAQFFTNKRPELANEFQALEEQHLISQFKGNIGFLSPTSQESAKISKRYIGTPSMNSFLKYWAQRATLTSSFHVSSIERLSDHWVIHSKEGKQFSGFDACVFTMPQAQGQEFWQQHSQRALPKVKMWPCWALMLVTEVTKTPFDSAFVREGQISWYSCEVMGHYQKWLIHAQPSWSEKHLESETKFIKQELIHSLEKLLNVKLNVLDAKTHRWRYASSDPNPSTASSLWDANIRLGYCADWFNGGRVEGAMQSAWELFKQLKPELKRSLR